MRSLRILSVTSLAVKVGEVKMKLSSSILSNSAFKASKAYIEKHEAAIFSRDLGFSVALRSSPSNRVMLSISSIASSRTLLRRVDYLRPLKRMPRVMNQNRVIERATLFRSSSIVQNFPNSAGNEVSSGRFITPMV